MGKYFLVFKNSIQRQMIYRFNTFAILLSGFISFGVLFYFWSSVYRQGNQVGTYSFEEIVSYYFLIAVVGFIARPNDIAWRIADEIRTGEVTVILLRPVNYFWYNFFQSLGSLVFVFFVYVPVVILMMFLLGDVVAVSGNVKILFFSSLSVILAFLINFILFFTIGISAFYFGMVKGLNYSTFVISMFLSGGVVPLDIFPEFFLKFVDFLPFKYTLYIPISLLSGRIEPEISMILIPLIWIIFMVGISFLVFKQGIKKYEGYGA